MHRPPLQASICGAEVALKALPISPHLASAEAREQGKRAQHNAISRHRSQSACARFDQQGSQWLNLCECSYGSQSRCCSNCSASLT